MGSEHGGADFAYISTINACNNTDDSIIGPTFQIRKSTWEGSPWFAQGHKGNKEQEFEVGRSAWCSDTSLMCKSHEPLWPWTRLLADYIRAEIKYLSLPCLLLFGMLSLFLSPLSYLAALPSILLVLSTIHRGDCFPFLCCCHPSLLTFAEQKGCGPTAPVIALVVKVLPARSLQAGKSPSWHLASDSFEPLCPSWEPQRPPKSSPWEIFFSDVFLTKLYSLFLPQTVSLPTRNY